MNRHANTESTVGAATYSRGARAVAGAVNFPLFLLIWSVGIVVLTGTYYPADALVRHVPFEFPELTQLSSLENEAALSEALEKQLMTASVFGGRWQPEIGYDHAEQVVDKGRTAEEQVSAVHDAVVQREVAEDAVIGERALTLRGAPLIEPELKLEKPLVVKRYNSNPVETQPGSDISDVVRTSVPTVAPAQGRALVAKREARRAIDAGNRSYAYRLLISEAAGGARDTEYLGLLAVSALSSGKAAEALLVYQRLLEFEPDDERWWAGLALSREHLGMNAAADYQEVLARGGADSPVLKLAQTRLKALG